MINAIATVGKDMNVEHAELGREPSGRAMGQELHCMNADEIGFTLYCSGKPPFKGCALN